jgi:hypothetical protein
MLTRDLAAEALRPLGDPTMDAFTDARTAFTKNREATKETRDQFASQVGAVVDGIDYWSLFATYLVAQYEKVPGVSRVNRHPLAHYWTLGNITVQLKSDTGNLPLDQLTIPGVHEGATNSLSEIVILTWDHDHSERYAPAFVQLDSKREAWRLPITALLAEPTNAVEAERGKATVTSSRPDVAAGGDATTAEQS